MSITRLQQARQMYAMGQRVARAFGGVMGPDGRKAYVGGSYSGTDPKGGNQGAGKYQGGSGAPGSAEAVPGGEGSNKRPTEVTAQNIDQIPVTGKNYKTARRNYEIGVAGGYANDPLKYKGTNVIGPFGVKQNPYNKFLNYKPQVKTPNVGILGMAMNLAKKPIQKFSDFTTGVNRNYFIDEVVRAGKIPGVNYGTISNMTNQELEEAYQNYLSGRLSGATDAYGNPIGGNDGGGEGDMQGIVNLYDDNMFDDTEENDPFVFRYAGEDNTLNPGASGVDSVAELRDLQQQKGENIYT